MYASVCQTKTSPLIERLRRYYGCGVYAGKVFCMIIALDYLIWKFLEYLFPEDTIEKAIVFPYQKYRTYFQDNQPSDYKIQLNHNNVIVEEDESDLID